MKWSVSDVICKRIPDTDIQNLKTRAGRKVSSKVIDALAHPDKKLQIKLLSHIHGMTVATATILLTNLSLSQVLSQKANGIEMMVIRSTLPVRRVGPALAARIVKYFDYKVASATPVNIATPK
jgi:hypothetical protein